MLVYIAYVKKMYCSHHQRFFAAWLRISPNIFTNWNILRITFFCSTITRDHPVLLLGHLIYSFSNLRSLSLSLSLSGSHTCSWVFFFIVPSLVFLIGFECSLQHEGIQNKTIMGHIIYDHNTILL